MLARLYVQMPFSFTVPEGERFVVKGNNVEGYTYAVYPPARSEAVRVAEGRSISMSGVPAFEADTLRIDFHRDAFNRSAGGDIDPPQEVIQLALSDTLARLRYVTRAAHATQVEFPLCVWRLQYLNDDETELPQEQDKVRGRGAVAYQFSFIGLNRQKWDEAFSLPAPFKVPVWDNLRLDAVAALPSVGTAVVLAAASLEVFIGVVLNDLSKRSAVPASLWEWINDRGNWLREPTVEEEFDFLLKNFCGHSLKEVPHLWEAFKNLRTARNGFAHRGEPLLGGKPLSSEDATKLIQKVHEIIDTIRAWLPADLQWPQSSVEMTISVSQRLFSAPATDAQNAAVQQEVPPDVPASAASPLQPSRG